MATHRISTTTRRDPGRAAVLLALALGAPAAMALGGCSHSLFKRGVQRSQYETYDTMRNRHAADYYEDEFGRERINLRGRLITHD